MEISLSDFQNGFSIKLPNVDSGLYTYIVSKRNDTSFEVKFTVLGFKNLF